MKKHIELPSLTKNQLEIVNGSLLGDGSLHHIKNTNFNWKFVKNQSQYDDKGVDKLEYMEYIFKFLEPYSTKLSKLSNKNKILNLNNKIVNVYGEELNKIYYFTTHCHPTWTDLAKIWYLWENGKLVLKNNKIIKVVPETLVLTPLTICIWFMDDGTLDSKRGHAEFYTNGFTIDECDLLIKKLSDFDIFGKIKLRNNYPIIYIGTKSHHNLINLISPFINWNCFKYKADNSYNKKHQQGEDHSQNKLTKFQVLEIIELYNLGVLQKEIAKKFNISQTTVSQIVTGNRWKFLNIVNQDEN